MFDLLRKTWYINEVSVVGFSMSIYEAANVGIRI
jgi:hypothetical protein